MRVSIFLMIFIFSLFAHDSPYSLEKFQNILNKTKLQAPKSSYDPLYSAKYGEFKYFQNRYFYLQDNRYMVFEMCGKKYRSELREKNDWYVTTSTPKILFAKVYLFPLNQTREFTFLQIHADSNRYGKNGAIINKPLLRITWWKERHNLYDHLWAVIRLSPNRYEKKYVKIDLGKRPKDFFSVKIEVARSRMKIFINNRLKIDKDVSYWNDFLNYFKAGVYLQDKGCSKVLFDELYIQ